MGEVAVSLPSEGGRGEVTSIGGNMRLGKVTGRPFIVFCLKCGEKLYGGDVDSESPKYPVYADLDGEPFKAYYCAQCAKEVQS